MKERPILFNTDMVRAILEGRKTQTRRLDGLKIVNENPDEWELVKPLYRSARGLNVFFKNKCLNKETIFDLPIKCPYGVVGDRLWVRETWAEVGNNDPGYLVYRATYPNCLPDSIEINGITHPYKLENIPDDIRDIGYKWRPSIHMPRSACRIILEITDIRVERVGDISHADVIAEGIRQIKMKTSVGTEFYYDVRSAMEILNQGGASWYSAVAAFQYLWDSVYEKRGLGWDKNPWVWVVEFKRVAG